MPDTALINAETMTAAQPTITAAATEPGTWAFVESKDATERRSRKGTDALFGNVSGCDLTGDSFGWDWERMRDRIDQYGKLQPPKWSAKNKESVRAYLPRLSIGGKTEIKLNSGIYYLTMKYENHSETPIEAGVVIGEIAFDNTGCVLAPGAKWKKILKGERQKEPRVGQTPKQKWYTSPVSEEWKNGDILRFKIDTNTKTLVYTLSAPGAKEVKAGWKFHNVLTFTSLPTYYRDIRTFAYCGAKGKSSVAAKFTIVDTNQENTSSRGSVSTTTEDEQKEEPNEAEPELTAAPESEPKTELAENQTDSAPAATSEE